MRGLTKRIRRALLALTPEYPATGGETAGHTA